MRTSLFALLLMIFAACTSAADVQRQCAATTEGFTAEIACMEMTVRQDPALNGDSFIEEYLSAGRVLSDQLQARIITENEARLEFAREYNHLLINRQQYSAYRIIELDYLRPRHTTCHPVGDSGTVQCTSF